MLTVPIRLAVFALAASLGLASAQPAGPDVLARQASTAMKSGDFARAEVLYRQLTEMFPEEARLALNLGLAQYSSGKFAEALVQLDRFLRAHPDHAPAWTLVGTSYQKLDQPARAVQPLQRAVELDPSNRIARLELADALLRSEQPDRAASVFEELAAEDRANPKAWLGLGLSFTELSRQASDALERSAPNSAYRLLLLAHSAQAQQRYRAAFGHYRAAMAVDPGVPGIHESVAEIYRELGRADWADAELAKRMPLAPCAERQFACWFESSEYARILDATGGFESPESLYWRARALSRMARDAHEELLALPPSSAAYRLLASIEDLAGRPRDAAEAWRKAIEMEPTDPALRRNLLRSLRTAGLAEDSIREAEALLRRRPDSAEARFYAGASMLELGRVDEAIPLLEAAIGKSTNDDQVRASLATAYLRAGRGSEAIPHLEAALESGEDQRLLFQLARAYQSAGRSDDARSALERRRAAMSALPASSVSNEITPP